MGRPAARRAAAIAAYARAASESKGRIRPEKSSWSTLSIPAARMSFRCPSGIACTPQRNSASLTADRKRSAGFCCATQSKTLVSGRGRSSSETTCVSRMIIAESIERHRLLRWFTGRDIQFYSSERSNPRVDGGCQIATSRLLAERCTQDAPDFFFHRPPMLGCADTQSLLQVIANVPHGDACHGCLLGAIKDRVCMHCSQR